MKYERINTLDELTKVLEDMKPTIKAELGITNPSESVLFDVVYNFISSSAKKVMITQQISFNEKETEKLKMVIRDAVAERFEIIKRDSKSDAPIDMHAKMPGYSLNESMNKEDIRSLVKSEIKSQREEIKKIVRQEIQDEVKKQLSANKYVTEKEVKDIVKKMLIKQHKVLWEKSSIYVNQL